MSTVIEKALREKIVKMNHANENAEAFIISAMDGLEKLSLFLDYFRDNDKNSDDLDPEFGYKLAGQALADVIKAQEALRIRRDG